MKSHSRNIQRRKYKTKRDSCYEGKEKGQIEKPENKRYDRHRNSEKHNSLITKKKKIVEGHSQDKREASRLLYFST